MLVIDLWHGQQQMVTRHWLRHFAFPGSGCNPGYDDDSRGTSTGMQYCRTLAQSCRRLPGLTRGDQGDTDFSGGLVRLGRQTKSGTRPVANLQAPAHILQSDAGPSRFRNGWIAAVLHDDAKFVSAQLDPHMNVPRLRALRDPVLDRILHQGLHREHWNRHVQRRLIDVELHFQAVAQPKLLNLQVRAHNLHLLSERHEGPVRLQKIPEDLRHVDHHTTRLKTVSQPAVTVEIASSEGLSGSIARV